MGEDFEDGFGAFRLGEGFSAVTVGKTFGQFGKDLQVLLVGVLGHQQHEQQRNGLAVRRIKRNRGTQAQQGAGQTGYLCVLYSGTILVFSHSSYID